jgi:lipopolysaccharide/colanic/teichoic acid biosynthesis glycosyltransferase
LPRILEIAIATVGLIVLSPLFLILACAIMLFDRRPVLYCAKRVGVRRKEFGLLKFRTMSPGSDKHGTGLTTRDDLRITRIGVLLRRFKLDELPQLLNVLRGDMSFVGPRPEDPRYVAVYSEEHLDILNHRPGITSPASLQYKDEAALLPAEETDRVYVEDILPRKLDLDLQYLQQRTVLSDLKLIFRTITQVTR